MPTIKGPITFKKNLDTGEMENIEEVKKIFEKEGIEIQMPFKAKGWKSKRLGDLVKEPVIDLKAEKRRLDRELEEKIRVKKSEIKEKLDAELNQKYEEELKPEIEKLTKERDEAYEKIEKEAKKEEKPKKEPEVEEKAYDAEKLLELPMAELREVGYKYDVKGKSKAEIVDELKAKGVAV